MLLLSTINPDVEELAPTIDFSIDLTGVEFRIVLRWDDRIEAWFIDLFDANDIQLARSKRLVGNYFLFDNQTDRRFPAGRLALIEQSETGKSAEFEDLGKRMLLQYFEPDEVVEPLSNEVLYTISPA